MEETQKIINGFTRALQQGKMVKIYIGLGGKGRRLRGKERKIRGLEGNQEEMGEKYEFREDKKVQEKEERN